MTNHPNRSGKHPWRNPRPDEVRAARLASGLDEAQAAALIMSSENYWKACETGEKRMHPGLFKLFNLTKPKKEAK